MSSSPTTASKLAQRALLSALIPIGVVLAAGFGVYWLGAPPFAQSRPALAVPEECLNFGEAWETNAFPWTMRVQNKSSKPIAILDFVASCQCVSIEPRKRLLQPNEAGDFRLTFDLRAQPTDGEAVRQFTINLAPTLPDGFDPQGGWQIKGRVRQPGRLVPKEIRFGDELVRGAPSVTTTVVFVRTVPVQRITASCEPAVATLEVHQRTADPDKYDIVVHPRMDMKAGPFKAEARLQITLPSGELLPPLLLPITGVFYEDVRCVPESVLLGAAPVGTTVQESILITSASQSRFELEQVDIPAGTTVQVKPGRRASEKRLKLAQEIRGTGDQTIVLRFRAHTKKGGPGIEVRVPIVYYGLVSRP